MSNYSVAQIQQWRLDANTMRLEGREILAKYTDAELAAIFNGIGPDRFPSWLRGLVSKLHPSLMAVALIHDVQWYERELRGAPVTVKQDRADFAASNAMFRHNGLTAAAYYHPDNWLARNAVRWDAIKFAWACNRNYGFESWKS